MEITADANTVIDDLSRQVADLVRQNSILRAQLSEAARRLDTTENKEEK
nr:MAG TPA: SWI5-dependent HO expression protein 3 [Caudoviricetes sp.]